jgi:hypothetical protein
MKIILLPKDGLGNQLFQYAAGLFFAKKYGATLEIVLRPEVRTNSFGHPRPCALSNFCISATVRKRNNWDRLICSVSSKKSPLVAAARYLSHTAVWRQREVEVWTFRTALPIPRSTDTAYIEGNFQAHQFADEVEERLRSEYRFSNPASGKNLELLNQIRACGDSVSVHIRRGDYQYSRGGQFLMSTRYQAQAMQILFQKVGNPTFYVFSDDITFARESLPKGYNVVFVDHNDEVSGHEDLRLMAACRHHIIANSTFSWWGAWLDPNPQKLVCTPKCWQNNALDLPDRDIVPPNWMRIAMDDLPE